MMDFPCPGCGGKLHWKPGAGALVCPNCGTRVDAPATSEPIVEHRLEDAATSAARGWGTETTTVSCDGCGASVDVSPSEKAGACPFCGSPQVHPDPSDDVIRPESVLPFAIEKADAVRQFRGWISGLWFRPTALKAAAQLEQIAGVYVPVWTFDTHARSTWTAESGTYYYEEQQVEVIEDGKKVQRTQRVQKTRWTPARGDHQATYDDWLVQASKGLDQTAIKGLQPYDMAKLRSYDESFLAGHKAERYAIALNDAWGIAQKEIGSAERSACDKLVPGDTHRNLEVRTAYADVRFKHTLLPVWIAAYRYEGKAYRYLVNGQTGLATGDAPYSKWKIAGAIAFVLFAVFSCMGVLSTVGAVGAAVSQ